MCPACLEGCATKRQIREKTPELLGASRMKCRERLGKSIFPPEECRERRWKCRQRLSVHEETRSLLVARLGKSIFPPELHVERR